MTMGKFEFNGEGKSLLWILIWRGFLTGITLGLYYPWFVVGTYKWAAKNTYIDGKRLIFKGNGGEFFGNYLLIWILAIITLGIYLPWGYCRILRWIASNTYFADEEDTEE